MVIGAPERRSGRARVLTTAVLALLAACASALLVPFDARAVEGLTSFTTAPSAGQIPLGQSVTDVATAVGNSSFGLPESRDVFANVTMVAGSPTIGVTSGGFAGATVGAIVSGTGIPAGTTVTVHAPGSNTLTLSAAPTATGSQTLTIGTVPVKLTVCSVAGGTTCSGPPTTVAIATSSPDVATFTRTYSSASFTPSAAGRWCFTATFSGDPNYGATETESNPTAECVTVLPLLTRFVSSPSSGALTLGGSVTDRATAVGSSDFGLPGSVVTLSNLTTTSGSVTVAVAGGGFPGVGLGDAVTGPGIPPATVVVNIVANTVTLSNAATATASGNATLIFGRYPVKFTICQVNSGTTCSGSPISLATAGSTTSASTFTRTYTSSAFTPSATGTWCFTAQLSKDPAYADAAESNPAAECVTVNAAGTTTTTTTTTGTTTTGTTKRRSKVPLEVQLVAVKIVGTRLGGRLAKAEVTANQTVSIALSLTRRHRTLAHRVARGVGAGDRIASLVIPARVTAGPAVLHVTVTARTGRKLFAAGTTVPPR